MQELVTLQPGQWATLPKMGRYVALKDTGAAASVELAIMAGAQEIESLTTMQAGDAIRTAEPFTSLRMRSAVLADVQIVVSAGAAEIASFAGAAVRLTGPVDLTRGAPGNPLSVTAVTVNDAPATGAVAVGPIACGPVAVQIVAAAANRRELRMTNIVGDPVAIVPPGGTWAQRVAVLSPGDTWVEDRGANLAWHAITDAGKAATVTALALTA